MSVFLEIDSYNDWFFEVTGRLSYNPDIYVDCYQIRVFRKDKSICLLHNVSITDKCEDIPETLRYAARGCILRYNSVQGDNSNIIGKVWPVG